MYQKTTSTLQTSHQEGIKKFFLRDLIKESSLKNENHIKPQSSIYKEINHKNNEIHKNFQSKENDYQQNKRNLAFDVIYTWETDTTSGLRFINVVNKKDKKKLGFQCIYCRDKQLFKKKSSVLYHLVTFNHSLKTSVVDDLKGCRFESDQRLQFISNLDNEKTVTKKEEPLEKREKEGEDYELIHKELEFISTLYLLTNDELKELFFFYFQEDPILFNNTLQKENVIEQFIQKINFESEKYSNLVKKTYDTSSITSQQNQYISLEAYLKEFKKETEKNCVLLNKGQEKEPTETNGENQIEDKEKKVGWAEMEIIPNTHEKQTDSIIKIVEENVNSLQNECIQESVHIAFRNEETQVENFLVISEGNKNECTKDLVNIKTDQILTEKKNKECKDKEIHIEINDIAEIVNDPLKHSEIVSSNNIVINNINKDIKKRKKYKKREMKIKEVAKYTSVPLCDNIPINQGQTMSNEMNIQNDNESKPIEMNREELSSDNSHDAKAHILSLLLNITEQNKKRKNDTAFNLLENTTNNLLENTANNKKRNKTDLSQLELSILNEIIEKIHMEPKSENHKEREQNEKTHIEFIKKNDASEKNVHEQIADLEKTHFTFNTDHSKDGDKKKDEMKDNKVNTLVEIKEKKQSMKTNDSNYISKLNSQDKRMKQWKSAAIQKSNEKNKGKPKKNNIINKTDTSYQKTNKKESKVATKIKTQKIVRNNPRKNIIKLKKKNSEQSNVQHGKGYHKKSIISHAKRNHKNHISKEKAKAKLTNMKTSNFSIKETKSLTFSPIKTRRQLYTTVQNSVQNIKTNF